MGAVPVNCELPQTKPTLWSAFFMMKKSNTRLLSDSIAVLLPGHDTFVDHGDDNPDIVSQTIEKAEESAAVAEVEIIELDRETVASMDAEVAGEDGSLSALVGQVAFAWAPVVSSAALAVAGFPDNKAVGLQTTEQPNDPDTPQSSGEASPFGPLARIVLGNNDDPQNSMPTSPGDSREAPPGNQVLGVDLPVNVGQVQALLFDALAGVPVGGMPPPAPIGGDQLMTANAFFFPST